jgi:hypothetical protein
MACSPFKLAVILLSKIEVKLVVSLCAVHMRHCTSELIASFEHPRCLHLGAVETQMVIIAACH